MVHYFITDGLIGGVLKRQCVKNRGPVQQERAPNTPKFFPAEEKQASSITCLQSMHYISLGGHCERQQERGTDVAVSAERHISAGREGHSEEHQPPLSCDVSTVAKNSPGGNNRGREGGQL